MDWVIGLVNLMRSVSRFLDTWEMHSVEIDGELLPSRTAARARTRLSTCFLDCNDAPVNI